MVIIGLVLVLIIPLTILYAKYSSESSYSITSSKADSIANQIITAANQVNVYGVETQVKLTIDLPSGINSISFNGKEIIFKIKVKTNEETEVVKIADASFSPAEYSPVTPGKKQVIIKSLPSNIIEVNIIGLKKSLE